MWLSVACVIALLSFLFVRLVVASIVISAFILPVLRRKDEANLPFLERRMRQAGITRPDDEFLIGSQSRLLPWVALAIEVPATILAAVCLFFGLESLGFVPDWWMFALPIIYLLVRWLWALFDLNQLSRQLGADGDHQMLKAMFGQYLYVHFLRGLGSVGVLCLVVWLMLALVS